MAPITRDAIRAELKNDPAGMGYHAVLAADPSPSDAITAMMNDPLRGAPEPVQTRMTLSELWEALPGAVASTFHTKFSTASVRALQSDANILFANATAVMGGVDWGSDKAQAVILGLFQKGQFTQAEYDAFKTLTHVKASRAQNLWGQEAPEAGGPDSVRGAVWNDDGSRWDWTK